MNVFCLQCASLKIMELRPRLSCEGNTINKHCIMSYIMGLISANLLSSTFPNQSDRDGLTDISKKRPGGRDYVYI